MNIAEVQTDKKRYLPLLLLGDEDEQMLDRYLARGVLLVGFSDGKPTAVCVYTDEGGGVWEVQNLAVSPRLQRRGLGREMLAAVEARCKAAGGHTLRLGTGDSRLTLPFYRACEFYEVGREPGYFPKHYPRPIYEGGEQLVDRVILEKRL